MKNSLDDFVTAPRLQGFFQAQRIKAPQSLCKLIGHINTPDLASFRWPHVAPLVCPFDFDKAAVPVDVTPFQPKQLTKPHARPKCTHEKGIVLRLGSPAHLQKPLSLFPRHWLHRSLVTFQLKPFRQPRHRIGRDCFLIYGIEHRAADTGMKDAEHAF